MKTLMSLVLGVGLFICAVLLLVIGQVHAKPGGAGVTVFVVGLAVAVILTVRYYYFDATYVGYVPLGKKNWPRIIFLMLVVAVVSYSIFSVFISHSSDLKVQIPRAVISLLLLWHAFAVVFGTFFAGMTIATLFYDPLQLLRSHRTRKKDVE